MRRMIGAIMAAVLALAILAGCGGAKQTPAENRAATPSADTTVAAPEPATPAPAGPTIEAIRQRGKLRVGTKHDVPKFGYKDPETNLVDGFEIDLVRRIARAIVGDETAFETVAVTPKTRVDMLNNGEIDLVVATFTVTEERKQLVDFSPVYYTDGVGLLVKKDSGIQSLKDMNGKKLGVVKKASSGPKMQARADEAGVTITLVEFDSYPEIKAGLLAGEVDAMSADGAILAGYVDNGTRMLPERYTQEPYGIATRKGNDDLQKVVTEVIRELEQSGELTRLQEKWGIKVGA